MDQDHNSELKQWLREDEGFKKWLNLGTEWIQHHNPELVITNSKGEEKERIDVNGYDAKKLEDLLKRKGFTRIGA